MECYDIIVIVVHIFDVCTVKQSPLGQSSQKARFLTFDFTWSGYGEIGHTPYWLLRFSLEHFLCVKEMLIQLRVLGIFLILRGCEARLLRS